VAFQAQAIKRLVPTKLGNCTASLGMVSEELVTQIMSVLGTIKKWRVRPSGTSTYM
jgi:hypothetical protein